MVPKNGTKVLSSVYKHINVAICIAEKIYLLDKRYMCMPSNCNGDCEVSVNEASLQYI